MMDKQQWTVLPASLIQDLPGLRLSPLGLVPQRGRRPARGLTAQAVKPDWTGLWTIPPEFRIPL
eukprot:jgi/Psemu1/23795/gm1.23795_g